MSLRKVCMVLGIYALIIILFLPSLLFLACLLSYRWVVTLIYTRIKSPSSAGLISGLDSIFLNYAANYKNGLFTNDVSAQVVLHARANGFIDLDVARETFAANLFSPAEYGNYKKLTQFVDCWMGYCFWREDEDFSMERHVRLYQSDVQEPFNLNEYLKTPMESRRSPWEILIVHEQDDGNTLVLIRVLHYLADGYSIFALLQKVLVGMEERPPAPKYLQITRRDKVLAALAYPFRAPIDLIFSETSSSSTAVVLTSKLADPKLRSLRCSRPIPCVNSIKAHAQMSQTSFSSVVVACLTQGLNNYFGSHFSCQKPTEYDIIVPVPAPNHSTGLTNEFYNLAVQIPAGAPKFPAHLHTVHEKLKRSITSTLPITWSLAGRLMSCLPAAYVSSNLARVWSCQVPAQIILSTFPGPRNEASFLAHAGQEISYLVTGLTPIRQLQFWVGAMPDVVPEQHMMTLVGEIEEQFQNLGKKNSQFEN